MPRAKGGHLLKERRQFHLAGFLKGHQPRHRLLLFRDGDFLTFTHAVHKLPEFYEGTNFRRGGVGRWMIGATGVVLGATVTVFFPARPG